MAILLSFVFKLRKYAQLPIDQFVQFFLITEGKRIQINVVLALTPFWASPTKDVSQTIEDYHSSDFHILIIFDFLINFNQLQS